MITCKFNTKKDYGNRKVKTKKKILHQNRNAL